MRTLRHLVPRLTPHQDRLVRLAEHLSDRPVEVDAFRYHDNAYFRPELLHWNNVERLQFGVGVTLLRQGPWLPVLAHEVGHCLDYLESGWDAFQRDVFDPVARFRRERIAWEQAEAELIRQGSYRSVSNRFQALKRWGLESYENQIR